MRISIAARRLRMAIRNHLLLSKWEFRLPPDVYGWVYVTIYFCLNGNFNCRQMLKLDHESPMTPLQGTHLGFVLAAVEAQPKPIFDTLTTHHARLCAGTSSSIYSKGYGPLPRSGPKGAPHVDTKLAATSRRSHVDKQFCMYVDTTSSQSSAALRLSLYSRGSHKEPEPLGKAPPRRPRGSERKKGMHLPDSPTSNLSGVHDITTLQDYMRWSAQ